MDDVIKALEAFDAAERVAEEEQIQQARQMLLNTYVIRAVNLCVERGILEPSLAIPIIITDRGHRSAAVLDASEDDLRETFDRLVLKDYINPSLEYSDVFNGVVGKGEVIH